MTKKLYIYFFLVSGVTTLLLPFPLLAVGFCVESVEKVVRDVQVLNQVARAAAPHEMPAFRDIVFRFRVDTFALETGKVLSAEQFIDYAFTSHVYGYLQKLAQLMTDRDAWLSGEFKNVFDPSEILAEIAVIEDSIPRLLTDLREEMQRQVQEPPPETDPLAEAMSKEDRAQLEKQIKAFDQDIKIAVREALAAFVQGLIQGEIKHTFDNRFLTLRLIREYRAFVEVIEWKDNGTPSKIVVHKVGPHENFYGHDLDHLRW